VYVTQDDAAEDGAVGVGVFGHQHQADGRLWPRRVVFKPGLRFAHRQKPNPIERQKAKGKRSAGESIGRVGHFQNSSLPTYYSGSATFAFCLLPFAFFWFTVAAMESTDEIVAAGGIIVDARDGEAL